MQCPICKQELVIKNKKVGETENGEAIYNEFAICHDCKKQWNLDKQRAKKDEPAKETKPAPKKKRPRPDADAAQADAPKPRKKKRPVDPEAANQAEAEKVSGVSENSERPKKKKRPAAASADAAVSREDAPRPKKKKRPVTDEALETARPKKRRPRPSVDEAATQVIDKPFEDFSDLSDDTYIELSKVKKRRPIDNTQPEQTYSNIPPKHIRESREREMRENYQNMLDEGEDEEERRFPIVLVVILILLVLAAAAFAGYWFLLR